MTGWTEAIASAPRKSLCISERGKSALETPSSSLCVSMAVVIPVEWECLCSSASSESSASCAYTTPWRALSLTRCQWGHSLGCGTPTTGCAGQRGNLALWELVLCFIGTPMGDNRRGILWWCFPSQKYPRWISHFCTNSGHIECQGVAEDCLWSSCDTGHAIAEPYMSPSVQPASRQRWSRSNVAWCGVVLLGLNSS